MLSFRLKNLCNSPNKLSAPALAEQPRKMSRAASQIENTRSCFTRSPKKKLL